MNNDNRNFITFVVIAAPEPDALREASYFVERLVEEDMPLAGVIMNRVHRTAVPQLSAGRALAAAETLEGEGGQAAALAAGVLRTHAQRMQAQRGEQQKLAGFGLAHPRVRTASAPAFAEDVHDLAGLRRLAAALCEG